MLPVVDLFCGAGGFSLGFLSRGFKVAAAFDSDSHHVATYSNNLGDHSRTVDLGKTTPEELRKMCNLPASGDFIMIGGPPCQGFSVGGVQRPGDIRNAVLSTAVHMADVLEPAVVAFENVPGLWGNAFTALRSEITATLTKKFHFEFLRLSADDFGVPQRRRRVFLVGTRRDVGLGLEPKKIAGADPASVGEALQDLPYLNQDYFDKDCWNGVLGQASTYGGLLRSGAGAAFPSVTQVGGELSGCMRTRHSKVVEDRFRALSFGQRDPISRFVRLDPAGFAPTLRAGTSAQRGAFMAPRPIHPTLPRVITVREAARLHSFPDSFQFHGTKWYAHMQIGNSVPPLVAAGMAEAVKNLLSVETRKAS